MNDEVKELPRTGLHAMPRGIWALGFVSMFMDISSEMIHGLPPGLSSRCSAPAPK